MTLVDFAVASLAAALVMYATGLNWAPRAQGLMAVVYASAALLGLGVEFGWRFIVLAMATGFVGTTLARLVHRGAGATESQQVGVANLRRRVPRL